MIAVIDYDAGNIKSVEKALQSLGEEVLVTRNSREILSADGVILPGVGSFGDAMAKLHSYGLVNVINEVVLRETPFLGICLGLQLLFEYSEESPGVDGLGILKGRVIKIPQGDGIKIPHIGWNSLTFPKSGRLFRGIPENSFVYFVHSYYIQAKDENIITALTHYNVDIQASVESGNVFACQFHPEKSSGTGLMILRNFIDITKKNKEQ